MCTYIYENTAVKKLNTNSYQMLAQASIHLLRSKNSCHSWKNPIFQNPDFKFPIWKFKKAVLGCIFLKCWRWSD
eukprot:c26205_g1_i1 orf=2-220(-)